MFRTYSLPYYNNYMARMDQISKIFRQNLKKLKAENIELNNKLYFYTV